jgi:hypothetical protein
LLHNGNVVSVKSSYKIDQLMTKVTLGQYIKITYLGEIPVSDPKKNAMRNYSLQVRK